MCMDPTPIKPSIYRLPSTPTLIIGQKQLFAGYPMGSHTPSLHRKASSSSRHTLQITPEKSNNSIGPPPPVSRSLGTGLDEGGDRRPRDRSQDPMPVDPQPFDYGELQKGQAHNQVYNRAAGTGKSRTDLQSTRGGRTASRRDVSGKGSRKLYISEVALLLLTTA